MKAIAIAIVEAKVARKKTTTEKIDCEQRAGMIPSETFLTVRFGVTAMAL
jgi:hypothetical protein